MATKKFKDYVIVCERYTKVPHLSSGLFWVEYRFNSSRPETHPMSLDDCKKFFYHLLLAHRDHDVNLKFRDNCEFTLTVDLYDRYLVFEIRNACDFLDEPPF